MSDDKQLPVEELNEFSQTLTEVLCGDDHGGPVCDDHRRLAGRIQVEFFQPQIERLKRAVESDRRKKARMRAEIAQLTQQVQDLRDSMGLPVAELRARGWGAEAAHKLAGQDQP